MADASLKNAPHTSPPTGLDRPDVETAQDEDWSWAGPGLRRGRLRIRTLIAQRWLMVAGQTVAVLVAGLGLDLKVPYALCFSLIALSAWLNVLIGLAFGGQRMAREGEATAQIAFDVLQLSGMLYLTGGITNPFSLLLIAPVTLAAATLPARFAAAIGASRPGCWFM
jgi:two-component system sensor histidine kinase RegB